MMNEIDYYRAKTTRHITLVLVYGFLVLILALLGAAFAPWPSSDKFVSIANPLLTGLLSLVSGAVGFWIGHRGSDDSTHTPPVTPAQQQEKTP